MTLELGEAEEAGQDEAYAARRASAQGAIVAGIAHAIVGAMKNVNANEILTDEAGRPFEKPEQPGSNCSDAEFYAWMRALYAYNDTVADAANRAFDDQFRKSMRRTWLA